MMQIVAHFLKENIGEAGQQIDDTYLFIRAIICINQTNIHPEKKNIAKPYWE